MKTAGTIQSSQNGVILPQNRPNSTTTTAKKKPTMIATNTTATTTTMRSNTSNNNASYLGGLWIDPNMNDGGTVCSDITSDHTAFTSSPSVTAADGGISSEQQHLLPFQSLASPSHSGTTPPSVSGKGRRLSTTTPNTVQSTPSRASPSDLDDVQSPPSPLWSKQLPFGTPGASPAAVASSSSATGKPQKRVSKTTGLADDGSFTEKPPAKTAATEPTSAGTSTKTNLVSSDTADKPSSKMSPAVVVSSKSNSNSNSNKNSSTKDSTGNKRTVVRKQSANLRLPSPIMDVPANSGAKKKTATTTTTNNKTKSKVTPKTTATTTAKPVPKKAPAKSPPTTAANNNTNTNSNNNAGLSELSKQLRVQRAKNEWQHNEIARLERQIKILSDLKGVSVAELRHSLESACQEEAHDELRNQVQSLQAQLEALQMQRDSARRRASTATNEATHQKIATLQLRIGELEEVDQAKQTEVQSLYRKCQEQQSRATRLEKLNAQQEAQMQQLEETSKGYVQNVERVRAERDQMQQEMAELRKKLQDQQAARRLEAEMRDIEQQIAAEKQRKAQYLTQARKVGKSHKVEQTRNNNRNNAAVSSRLSQGQLEAIQGVVGNHGGLPKAVIPCDVSTTSTGTANTTSSLECSDAANNSQVFGMAFDGDDDAVSHLGEDDTTVNTMDALRLQGMSEEQAKEVMAKDAKIVNLYHELRQHTTKASQLETLVANQKAQMEQFMAQLDEKEDILKSTKSNYDFAKNEHESLYKRFCDIELQLTLEQEKAENLEGQLNARFDENNLRDDQFKCRFQVQNERIADLEQQQQSLYAAFELLQQEVRQQDNEHTKLRSNLGEADSEVARQLLESDKKQGSTSPSERHSPTNDSSANMDHHQIPPHASLSESHHSLNTDREFQQLGLDHPMRMSGYLWKLDKIKGWKRRYFVLYGSGGVYHMTYSDGPREHIKGTIDCITMGVSQVAETNKSIKKPFSFVLHVDPLENNAPVLYAAAMNSDDFSKWMAALRNATIRPEDSMYMTHGNGMSLEAQQAAEEEMSQQFQVSNTHDLRFDDPESQMEADRMMAMRMNIQNQSDQAFA